MLKFFLPVFALALSAAAQSSLLGYATIPPNARDLNDETIGSFGSGVAWDKTDKVFFFVSDRGPGDGAVDFRPRLQAVEIPEPEPQTGFTVRIRATKVFLDPQGKPFSGLIPDPKSTDQPRRADGRWCIDSEGIAIAPDGTLYVSDEYGPFIYQFGREGKVLRVLRPPEHYLPHNAAGTVDFGEGKNVAWGRMPNRGFEGVAVTPDGKLAVALLQGPLAQDGGKEAQTTRLLAFDLASGKPVAEYAYRFEDVKKINSKKKADLKPGGLSVTDITAFGPRQFLVMERDNRGQDGSASPKKAVFKGVFVVDLADATNLLELPGQPHSQKPDAASFVALDSARKLKPVKKTLLFDLTEMPLKDFHLKVEDLSEKWEGLALRPASQPGHHTLLMSSDNDFLNPELHIDGKDVPFPRAEKPLPTQLFFFDVALPPK